MDMMTLSKQILSDAEQLGRKTNDALSQIRTTMSDQSRMNVIRQIKPLSGEWRKLKRTIRQNKMGLGNYDVRGADKAIADLINRLGIVKDQLEDGNPDKAISTARYVIGTNTYQVVYRLRVKSAKSFVVERTKMTTAEARFIVKKISPQIKKSAFVWEQDIKWLLANQDSIPPSGMIYRWGRAFKDVVALQSQVEKLPDPLPQNFRVRVGQTVKRHVVAAMREGKGAQMYDAARQLEMAATALRSFDRMMKRLVG